MLCSTKGLRWSFYEKFDPGNVSLKHQENVASEISGVLRSKVEDFYDRWFLLGTFDIIQGFHHAFLSPESDSRLSGTAATMCVFV